MYATMPQCQNIILGGNHDNGHARVLSNLETANVSPGKVILLQVSTLAPEIERFDSFVFPRIKFRDLFMEKKFEPGKRYAQVAADGIPPAMRKSASPPRPSTQKLVEPDLSIFSSSSTNSRRMVVS
jgi:hypothetical protein